jgi:putative membrane protein
MKMGGINMKNMIIKFIIICLSLFAADWLIEEIHFNNWESLVLSAVVFGLINVFVKPILVVLTLPITLLTLGIFLLVINVLLYWLTSAIVPGFVIDGWWGIIAGAFVTWVVSFILSALIGKR